MVPQSAVIVWQLRGFVEDVTCYFVKQASSFTLSVERAGERLSDEQFSSLRTLMDRARDLRRSLVAIGFAPAAAFDSEPQPVLESLLLNFVKEGTAALHVSRGA
jgi:uncharacterized membrane protein